MNKAKVVSSSLATNFKLSTKQSIEEEKEDIERVLYALAVGSLMYIMVCMRLDIAQAVVLLASFF